MAAVLAAHVIHSGVEFRLVLLLLLPLILSLSLYCYCTATATTATATTTTITTTTAATTAFFMLNLTPVNPSKPTSQPCSVLVPHGCPCDCTGGVRGVGGIGIPSL